jgi:hypothetical protein
MLKTKTREPMVLVIRIWVIEYCFEFRAWDLEFDVVGPSPKSQNTSLIIVRKKTWDQENS